ncbi:Hypothetical predicted protein [Paramuricea clavata]|uniref:Uncharacterized protein n=1 Tax=Paramuricea clavata TaxID=317549 RepID=A0A6S7FLL6_PARCT|nr:Hypothetical predicted protein [Paramuricea clavata]
MGNEIVKGIGLLTGLPLAEAVEIFQPEASRSAVAGASDVSSLYAGHGLLRPQNPFDPLRSLDPGEALKDLLKSLQESLSSLTSSSSSKDAGHFILVLLFTAWQEYIAKVCS